MQFDKHPQKMHVPNDTSSPTWTHHKEKYGTEFLYDDFIPQWKADEWDPKDWLDLFVDAGAVRSLL